ncbi:AI-2E family transporter [Azospirillum doebereinerae]
MSDERSGLGRPDAVRPDVNPASSAPTTPQPRAPDPPSEDRARLAALRTPRSGDVERIAVAMLFLTLVAGCMAVLRPFLAAMLWAAILAFSTWPLHRRLERLLGGRRTLSALLMTLAIAAALIVPLAVMGAQLADNVVTLAGQLRFLAAQPAPPPPAWLAELPLVGGRLAERWARLGQNGTSLAVRLEPYVGFARDWILGVIATLAAGGGEVAISVLTSFFIYRDGSAALRMTEGVAHRVAGSRARHLLNAAGAAVNGIVRGVLGTALIQSFLLTGGFLAAGVPAAFLLGFLSFFLSFIPLGVALVWGPAALWLSSQGAGEWAVALALWSVLVVGGIDHVLKPIIISRSGNLPFLLIFLGMLGGAAAFGLLGLFLGPTLLAVGHSLIVDWSGRAGAAEPPGR